MSSLRTCRLVTFFLLLAAGGLSGTALAEEDQAATVVIDRLEWMRTGNGEYLRWPDADDYCKNLELAGHADWRLPTMDELEAMRDPDAETGMRAPMAIDTCCLWSSTTLDQRESPDSDEIGGSVDMYRWGYMFDQDVPYYAVHLFDDGQALCVREVDSD